MADDDNDNDDGEDAGRQEDDDADDDSNDDDNDDAEDKRVDAPSRRAVLLLFTANLVISPSHTAAPCFSVCVFR